MPLPLALTDDQRDTLMRCASALQRADRDRFLQLSRVARLRQRMCSSHIRNSPKAKRRNAYAVMCIAQQTTSVPRKRKLVGLLLFWSDSSDLPCQPTQAKVPCTLTRRTSIDQLRGARCYT